ncbi:MAG: hypothetical protein K2H86_00460 [Muribaculaceae bacterium]|nr:hypothetical protein [Muribaculaceae bacterium]
MSIKNFYFQLGLLAVVGLISCSSPADKAKKIEEGLSENGGVLYKELEGENPQIVTYSLESDSTTVILVDNLKSDRTDTLSRLTNCEIVEVVPVEDGWLYVAKQAREDGKEHFLYKANIKRHIDNPKEQTLTSLDVVDGKENLWASGYVIDREGRKITLSSYEMFNDYFEIYHTVYDFKGNKVVEDPIHIDIPKPQPQVSESSNATYLWQCDKCGKRVNSGKKPRVWGTFGFEGCINATAHEWVNLGRVN